MAASLTTSRSVDEIYNLLLCGICKKTINEPKILSCSHSFCKACVENLATQDKGNVDGRGKKLNCPTCRSTTTLKRDENVAGLPNHEFILKLLTAVGPNRNSICSFCKKEPSITICMECELLLCQSCCGSHDMWPRNNSHILVSISEIINRDQQQKIGAEVSSCTQHKDAIPTFYCETCKELICMKCVASVHTKPGHTCVAIHEIYRKEQDDVKSKCATINAMLQEGNKALETVNNSKATYEKTWKDIKVKHTTQKDEMEMKMVKIVTNGTNKILENKIKEVDKAYDPACQKLSVQAEMISNYLQKVEKSLQRTNDVLENSKLEELLSAQKVIDDDIRMLRNERPQNLTTFQIQVENEESCMKRLLFFTLIKELSANYSMPETVILRNEEKLFNHLLSFLEERNSPLKLCYRASAHGWSSQDFHKLCDDKAGTVVLVKVGNCIFGGYTDQTWQGSGWKSSNASFLFSLRNPNNMQPFKCPIINGQNGSAILCDPSYGATFGRGNDLYICSNANSNQNSHNAYLGATYQPPPGYQPGTQQTQSLFAGSKTFTPTEIEVFY